MKQDTELVAAFNALLAVKDTWLERSLVDRQSIVKQFHKKVEDISEVAPYNTDDGIVHHYGDGTYGREANVMKGVAIVGSVYKEPQINILLKGTVFVMTENIVDIMIGPCIFSSDAGTNKVGYVIEDMQWITVVSRSNLVTNPEEIMREHIKEE